MRGYPRFNKMYWCNFIQNKKFVLYCKINKDIILINLAINCFFQIQQSERNINWCQKLDFNACALVICLKFLKVLKLITEVCSEERNN